MIQDPTVNSIVTCYVNSSVIIKNAQPLAYTIIRTRLVSHR